jgi:uncharacterized protein YndB with AHSA1/START domain
MTTPAPRTTARPLDRIVQTIDLAAPPSRVWRALTDHREFGARFRDNLESPFTPGKPTRGRIAYPGFEHVVFEAIVQAMEPERLFSYTWHPYAIDPSVDYSKEPPTLVEFTLERIPTGTRLTVTESGFDRIPAHRRDEAFRMNSGGWAQQVKNIEAHVSASP